MALDLLIRCYVRDIKEFLQGVTNIREGSSSSTVISVSFNIRTPI